MTFSKWRFLWWILTTPLSVTHQVWYSRSKRIDTLEDAVDEYKRRIQVDRLDKAAALSAASDWANKQARRINDLEKRLEAWQGHRQAERTFVFDCQSCGKSVKQYSPPEMLWPDQLCGTCRSKAIV